MTLPLAVDVEAMLIRVLTGAGFQASDQIGPPWPMLRVFSVTSDRFLSVFGAEMIQIDAWGEPHGSKADTRALIDQALAVCYALGEGNSIQPEGVVSSVVHNSGPGWLPDPTDQHPRYTATITVHAHPDPGGE